MKLIEGIASKAEIQKLLKVGFDEKNIEKFEEAIWLGAKLNEPFVDGETEKTAYELVLSTFGYSEFVSACHKGMECEVNYVSSWLWNYWIEFLQYLFIFTVYGSEKQEAW